MPYLVHKIPRSNGSGFWLVAIQVIASFNLLLSIVVFSLCISNFRFHAFSFPNSYFDDLKIYYIFVNVECGIYRWPLVFWGIEGGAGGVLAIYGLVKIFCFMIVWTSSFDIMSIDCLLGITHALVYAWCSSAPSVGRRSIRIWLAVELPYCASISTV